MSGPALSPAVLGGSRGLAPQPPSPRFRCHTPGPQARLLVPRLPPPPSQACGESQEIEILSEMAGRSGGQLEGAETMGPPPRSQESLSVYQPALSGQPRSSRSCHAGRLPPGPSLPALCPSAPPAFALVLILLDKLADSHPFLKTSVLNFLVCRGTLRASLSVSLDCDHVLSSLVPMGVGEGDSRDRKKAVKF